MIYAELDIEAEYNVHQVRYASGSMLQHKIHSSMSVFKLKYCVVEIYSVNTFQ
jgi:hypothetical protein